LSASKVVINDIWNSEKWTSLKVNKTKELQNIHEKVLKSLKEYLSSEMQKNMFYNPSEINDLTIKWSSNYIKKSSLNNFSPHISVWIWDTKEKDLLLNFKVDKINICQLWNYCTCRKIL
jgi:hypothetical protein